jgi:hypothetical protein
MNTYTPSNAGLDAAAHSKPLPLNAGPLTLIYEAGYIRSIYLGGVEIVRRVYAAIRDEFWNTVPGTIDEFSLQQNASSFQITYTSRHRKRELDFIWNAEITGKTSGEIGFSLRGIALTRFRRNRIGLCVLHPLSTCKGKRCRVETVDTITEERVFPVTIAPQLPFINIRALSYPIVSGLDATLHFEGDTFETEDQRNWTDATYKTYSTPLSLPIPVTIEKGTLINQKITINIDKPSAPIPRIPLAPTLDLSSPAVSSRLPSIGVLENGFESAGPEALRRIKKLGLSHIRVDIAFEADDPLQRLEKAAAVAAAVDRPIELALHFGSDPRSEAEHLATLFKIASVPVCRLLLFRPSERSISAETVLSVTGILRKLQEDVVIAGGTDGHFLEINRKRPPADLLDALTFAATPQVHTFDNIAIMENLPGLCEALQTAAAFSLGRPRFISPLTLRPRKKPALPLKDGGPDDRQRAIFAAAWLAGALAWCARGNATGITLGPMTGPDGLLSHEGDPYPLTIPLYWLARHAGIPAVCRFSSEPSRIAAIEWRADNQSHTLLINASHQEDKIEIRGLPDRCSMTLLNEISWQMVKNGVDPWDTLPRERITPKNRTISLELGPYALALLREEESPALQDYSSSEFSLLNL